MNDERRKTKDEFAPQSPQSSTTLQTSRWRRNRLAQVIVSLHAYLSLACLALLFVLPGIRTKHSFEALWLLVAPALLQHHAPTLAGVERIRITHHKTGTAVARPKLAMYVLTLVKVHNFRFLDFRSQKPPSHRPAGASLLVRRELRYLSQTRESLSHSLSLSLSLSTPEQPRLLSTLSRPPPVAIP